MKLKTEVSIITKNVLILLMVMATLSCSDYSNKESRGHFFRQVPANKTGVEFRNLLVEDINRNFTSYMYYYNGGGVAIGDVNHDDLPDLFFTANMGADRLYINKGGLRFEETTLEAGIPVINSWSTGATMVDINNDTHLDIYVCQSGQQSFRNNKLFINDGTGKFTNKAREYGLDDNGFSTQATFFDYDLDGDLDMYLVNHSTRFWTSQQKLFAMKDSPRPSEADKLYRNNGDNTFTDVTKQAGLFRFAFGLSANVLDVNNDQWPDIYVANDFYEPDFCYINNGDGTFTERLNDFFGHTSLSSMGSDVADINNDGFMDIFTAEMMASTNSRQKANMASMNVAQFEQLTKAGYNPQYMQNSLHLSNGVSLTGKARYSQISRLAGVAETDWSWGGLFLDVDHDSFNDLFVTNGVRRDIQAKDAWSNLATLRTQKKVTFEDIDSVFPTYPLNNFFFHNKGDLSFDRVSEKSGLDFKGYTTGAAYSDLDRDGDLDLVINNVDDLAAIFENIYEEKGNFLTVRLEDFPNNYYAIGARVEIFDSDIVLAKENYTSRGFQSSVEPLLHFGVGSRVLLDSVKVIWPSGKVSVFSEVSVNQTLKVSYRDAFDQGKQIPMLSALRRAGSPSLFTEQELLSGHPQYSFDDYQKQPLLPHKYSNNGPVLVASDVNGDGVEDIYIGASHGNSGKLFIQNSQGKFILSKDNEALFRLDAQHEDMDALFFDLDGDFDQDLYVVSGSNEFVEGKVELEDRVYINDGNGIFSKYEQDLSFTRYSGAVVCSADYDKDGDFDLFVGNRIVPGKYGHAPQSLLIENDNGLLIDVTDKKSIDLSSIGMVTDALWCDFDQDQDEDLIVVGEWMSVSVFKNERTHFSTLTDSTLANLKGWWYTVSAADVDQDGDQDFILGNIGTNYKHEASQEYPFEAYIGDFDQNEESDIVLGFYEGGKLYPSRGRECSSQQIPSIKKKFKDYTSFSTATLGDIYGKGINSSIRLSATTFASGILKNNGPLGFQFIPFSNRAQISSINEIVVEDFNKDSYPDLILAGNKIDTEAETPRLDASLGQVWLNNRKGEFRYIEAMQSGLWFTDEVSSLVTIQLANNTMALVAGSLHQGTTIYTTKEK